MKNRFIIIFIFLFFESAWAENLNIQSSNITFDKQKKLTVFKENVVAVDTQKNTFKTQYAEYDKTLGVLYSKGATTLLTSEGYFLEGENLVFDNKNKVIKSDFPAVIKDLDDNKISLDKFEYSVNNKFFSSTGSIKILDTKNNSYNFTQFYLDEKKKEILGTDIKAYLNDENFKVNSKNKPRVFANTVKINSEGSEFTKSIFTLCDYRKNDKCPPWSLQAKDMRHDKKKKTIYYDNAVIKVYDIPIFYTPKLSHPDPTVARRSGFLPPTFSDSKNLGSGFKIPYFWALDDDKDLTFSTKLFVSENPLFLGEYRQAFKNSNLIFDFGYTEGYKKTSKTKVGGNKSHFFSKFVKNFKGENNSENSLEVSLQDVSNDKYLKLYKIKSNLVDYQTDNLENSLNFTHTQDDLFLGFQASALETLKENYNDKYEYILPDILLDKNLFSSNRFGTADFRSNLKVHNYDTNKFTKFLTNDIDWKFRTFNPIPGLESKILGKLKNVNYEVKNVDDYKKDPNSEFFGALGYLTELNLYKDTSNRSNHLLTPKFLFRYAPNHMRKENDGARLNHLNIFDLDRLNTFNNFESGLSATLGFDYKIKNAPNDFNFSLGQIINEKENKNMPSSSSLDEKLSDLIGASNLKINNKLELNYNFAVDQNYNEFNYNEIGTNLNFKPVQIDFSYLQEKEHIGSQEYFKSKAEISNSKNGLFSFETKRNLITNSSEYYNLSYEYLNDCLRAGLVYRREFYNDSELEPENSLMFKITLTPFGNINTPAFNN